MVNLYLVRGLPGAGKTSFAKSLGIQSFAADDYFDKHHGGEFKPELLSQAHQWCQNIVEEFIRSGESVAVHNTFTREWEMEPYYKIADKFNCRVFSIIMENRHEGKSVHNVPESTVEKMRKRFEVKL